VKKTSLCAYLRGYVWGKGKRAHDASVVHIGPTILSSSLSYPLLRRSLEGGERKEKRIHGYILFARPPFRCFAEARADDERHRGGGGRGRQKEAKKSRASHRRYSPYLFSFGQTLGEGGKKIRGRSERLRAQPRSDPTLLFQFSDIALRHSREGRKREGLVALPRLDPLPPCDSNRLQKKGRKKRGGERSEARLLPGSDQSLFLSLVGRFTEFRASLKEKKKRRAALARPRHALCVPP